MRGAHSVAPRCPRKRTATPGKSIAANGAAIRRTSCAPITRHPCAAANVPSAGRSSGPTGVIIGSVRNGAISATIGGAFPGQAVPWCKSRAHVPSAAKTSPRGGETPSFAACHAGTGPMAGGAEPRADPLCPLAGRMRSCARRSRLITCIETINQDVVAEEVGFEPTVGFHPRRFSRPVHSTTLPLLRGRNRIAPPARFWKRASRPGVPGRGGNRPAGRRGGRRPLSTRGECR